ncbi:HAD-IA family hydrolase [Candidatus Saccharibacteria bacterium]|nr:HAD-IA family hydrolase [Candidatus Saccharibacteria bacterium]
MIKAITFDLDGVYFPSGKANFIKAVVSLGVAEDEVKRVFLKSFEMNERYKIGVMTDDEFWTWAAEQWQLDMAPKQLIELLGDSYEVDPKVVEVVRMARRSGYKTLVCSNNFPARVNELQRKFAFLDNFDAAVFSYEIGAVKPSEAIFQELVKRSGVMAEEIAFADDDAEKISGAVAIGMTAFVYDGFEPFIDHLNSLGVKLA